ncbi:MAG: DUF1343 domain-containing protein [Verrucomicrobiota bacterium]
MKLGIDVLEERGFADLKGKRVGLITNATGIDSRGVSTVDILLHAPGVQLVALFGPEHGVYGSDWAGQNVASSIDPHTGLPVYSLYGATRKPTPQMLQNIDVSGLRHPGHRLPQLHLHQHARPGHGGGGRGGREVLRARPARPAQRQPRRGHDGRPEVRSFTSQWDIPYVYGMTPGELAYMIRSTPGWIKKAPSLTIVSMEGWYRSMYWEDTGLMWVPTSPHIPTAETALNYVATGFLGEAGGISNGVGYTLPFAVFGHPSFSAFTLADELNAMLLPGLYFEPITYKPFYSLFRDQVVNGVQIYYTDRDQVNLCNLAVQILYRSIHAPGTHMFRASADGESGPSAFDHIAGTDALRLALQGGKTPEEIIAAWQPALVAFREARRPFLLYGERPRAEAGN